MLLSLGGNLGLLFFFKYYDFATHLINQGLQSGGFEITVPALGLLLPVGISFYTFQTLSYTIDVYRGNLAVERSFLKFSLYVTFFPQLVAGPIVRASEFIPDIKQGIYHFLPSGEDFNYGAFQFLGGLIKKMMADWLAFGLIDRVYESPDMFTAGETLIVFYAYGLQIYGDFSGYTDMALGAARLMGF
ncbi:MAG: MBOAT family protein, partial [Leptospiraceae bacterium]|nr:MBOAT family protein [Leptospiraceae bacterium]